MELTLFSVPYVHVFTVKARYEIPILYVYVFALSPDLKSTFVEKIPVLKAFETKVDFCFELNAC